MTSVPCACGSVVARRISARSPQPATTGSGVTTEMAFAALTSAAASLEGSMCAAVICALGTVTKRYCTLPTQPPLGGLPEESKLDRKSTRLNSSHLVISYAVFCLKKKKKKQLHVMSG